MLRRPVARRVALLALAALAVGCRSEAPAPPATPAPSPRAWFRPLTGRSFERTPTRVERGRYLADGILQCFVCHSDRDWKQPGAPRIAGRKYAGHVWTEDDGRSWLVSPNLTPDPETGIGRWTDDMLARAIREGVGHDGRPLHPQMWYPSFRSLSDEDLASVVVYLRSLAPIHNPLPLTQLPAGRGEQIQASLKPLSGPVPERDLSDPVARGKYLVEIADCWGCHTAWGAPRNPGLLGGGNAIERGGRTVFSTNLTPDPSGIPYYDAGLFAEVMREGRVKGRVLDGSMPWIAFRNLNDADLAAIFAFLATLPPVAHAVSNVDAATSCAVCGQKHGFGDGNRVREIPRAPVDPAVFQDYVGRYTFEDDDEPITIAREGDRLLWLEGETRFELIPQSESRFRAHELEVPVRFVKDDRGRVSHMLLEVEEIRILRQP